MGISTYLLCHMWDMAKKQTWPPLRCKSVADYPLISPIRRPSGMLVLYAYELQLLYHNCALSVCQRYFSCASKVAFNDPS